MKRFFSMLAIATLVFSACKDEQVHSDGGDPSVQGVGTVNLQLTPSGSFIDTQSKADAAVNVNNFNVKIFNSTGVLVQAWDEFRDFPNVLSLVKGAYSIEASSPGDLPAAFDQPIYKGRQSFTIEPSKLATVNVVCTLSNMKVDVFLTNAFKAEIKEYEIVISTTGEHTGILTFNSGNVGASGYFKVAPLTIQVTGKRVLDNTEISQTVSIVNVAPQDYHKLTFDAVETGNMRPDITIDATTNDKETSIVIPGEGEDEVTTPVITGDGIAAPLVLTDAQAVAATVHVATSTPGSTIANLWLEFNSPALTESVLAAAGLTRRVDLAHLEVGSALEQALKGFGLLPVSGSSEASVLGQVNYTFTINAALIALLPSDPTQLPTAGTGDQVNHLFNLTLTDANGYSTDKVITITRKMDPPVGQVPTITGPGILEPLVITDTQIDAGETPVVEVTVATPGSTIAEFWVELDSPALTDELLSAVGLMRRFDLANLVPGSDLETGLLTIQLIPQGYVIKGEASYKISITTFIGLLPSDATAIDPPVSGLPSDHLEHRFHVTVKDSNGKTSTATLMIDRQMK